MLPVDQVRFSLPQAALSRRTRLEAAPADPTDQLTLIGRDLRKNKPTPADLVGFRKLAESEDPLLRRIAFQGANRVGRELDRPSGRIDPHVAAVSGAAGMKEALIRAAQWVQNDDLPVKELLVQVRRQVGKGPVPEETLRGVCVLTTVALQNNQHAKECTECLEGWQKSGQIQLEGSPELLARGFARVEGNRVLPLPAQTPLSPLSASLLEQKELPEQLPADLDSLELLTTNERLAERAVQQGRQLPEGFLTEMVQRGLFDQWSRTRAPSTLLKLCTEPPEPLLQVAGRNDWDADVLACETLGKASPELAARAASQVIERVDSETCREHHLALFTSALDSGWKPSKTEAQWLVAQLFDERYLHGRSITCDSGGFAHVSQLTTLLAKTEKLHPGIFSECKLPDCSGRLTDLRGAMVDIMRHNCEDQAAARVDPTRHPEMKGYYELAQPTGEEIQGMIADLKAGFKEVGLYKQWWGKEQMALHMLSLAPPEDRALAQDAVRPLLVFDTWRWTNTFSSLPEVLNRFRDQELEGAQDKMTDLAEGGRLLLVSAQRGQDAATMAQTSDLARRLWQNVDHEEVFSHLRNLPAKLDDLLPEAMAPVLLAALNDPERTVRELGEALPKVDTARYSKSLQGKILLDLRDRDHHQTMDALRRGEIPPGKQPEVVDALISFRESKLDDAKARKKIMKAWRKQAPVKTLEFDTFRLLAEVRGDRAYEAYPLYQLVEKTPEPEQAFRDLCARLDRGVPPEEALRQTLAAAVVGGASEGPAVTMGVQGGQLRVGGTTLRVRTRT